MSYYLPSDHVTSDPLPISQSSPYPYQFFPPAQQSEYLPQDASYYGGQEWDWSAVPQPQQQRQQQQQAMNFMSQATQMYQQDIDMTLDEPLGAQGFMSAGHVGMEATDSMGALDNTGAWPAFTQADLAALTHNATSQSATFSVNPEVQPLSDYQFTFNCPAPPYLAASLAQSSGSSKPSGLHTGKHALRSSKFDRAPVKKRRIEVNDAEIDKRLALIIKAQNNLRPEGKPAITQRKSFADYKPKRQSPLSRSYSASSDDCQVGINGASKAEDEPLRYSSPTPSRAADPFATWPGSGNISELRNPPPVEFAHDPTLVPMGLGDYNLPTTSETTTFQSNTDYSAFFQTQPASLNNAASSGYPFSMSQATDLQGIVWFTGPSNVVSVAAS